MSVKPAPGDSIEREIDPSKMPGIKGDRTTEEIVADIVSAGVTAAAPEGHNVTEAERKRRAIEQARREQADLDKFFDEEEPPKPVDP